MRGTASHSSITGACSLSKGFAGIKHESAQASKGRLQVKERANKLYQDINHRHFHTSPLLPLNNAALLAPMLSSV